LGPGDSKGILALGINGGEGVDATGGATGVALKGTSGATSGNAIEGFAVNATGHGVRGQSDTTAGFGVLGVCTTFGDGVRGETAGGRGVQGQATSFGTGVLGNAFGTGRGVQGQSASGDAVIGFSTSGYGGRFLGNVTRSNLHLDTLAADPSTSVRGNVITRTTNRHVIRVHDGGGWRDVVNLDSNGFLVLGTNPASGARPLHVSSTSAPQVRYEAANQTTGFQIQFRNHISAVMTTGATLKLYDPGSSGVSTFEINSVGPIDVLSGTGDDITINAGNGDFSTGNLNANFSDEAIFKGLGATFELLRLGVGVGIRFRNRVVLGSKNPGDAQGTLTQETAHPGLMGWFYNETGVQIVSGTVVKLHRNAPSNNFAVTPTGFQYDDDAIGVAFDNINDDNWGRVVIHGFVTVRTTGSGFINGSWLTPSSTAGVAQQAGNGGVKGIFARAMHVESGNTIKALIGKPNIPQGSTP